MERRVRNTGTFWKQDTRTKCTSDRAVPMALSVFLVAAALEVGDWSDGWWINGSRPQTLHDLLLDLFFAGHWLERQKYPLNFPSLCWHHIYKVKEKVKKESHYKNVAKILFGMDRSDEPLWFLLKDSVPACSGIVEC